MEFRQIAPDVARAAFVGCTVLFLLIIGGMRARLGPIAAWVAPPRCAVVALALGGSVVWCLINGQVEGATLLTLTPRHGITEADLLVVPHLGIAFAVAVRHGRHGAPHIGRTDQCTSNVSREFENT